MKKVFHLISTNSFSGAENVACQIIQSLNKDDYKMYYVTEIGENKKSLKDRNISVLPLKSFTYSEVKKLIKKEKPDIIHAHDAKSCIMAALCSKKIKIIAHIHGNHENMRVISLKSILFLLFSNKFSSIVWVSKSALDNYKFKKKVSKKSVVLYNVIDVEDLKKKIMYDENSYDFDLIFLGRLSYPKNPLRLIKIMNSIVMKRPSTRLAIVGNGDLEDEIREKIKSLKLQNNIIMKGFMSNPYKLLASSKIMIMTSIYEGTPMCALEAIACGLPIVTTPTDGLKEIVKHGETGFISDDDDELANYVLSLLENKQLMKTMRDDVLLSNYYVNNLEKYINEISSIYQS
ncbi:MAG: glycosyltransferase [Lachnospiraceae bacterium]|nr:glycosyltransferase [Lachnospiraceae bacterium]